MTPRGRVAAELPAAAALGFAFAALPLYPAFISLAGVGVPGISLVPAPAALALLIAVAVAVAVGIALLIATPKIPMPTLVPLLAAFPANGLLAAACGLDPFPGVLFATILFFGAVWHAAILRFAGAPAALRAICWSYVLSGAGAALVALLTVATKVPAALYTIGHGRAVGTFVLPGELAGYLILYLPIAFTLARTSTSAALRTFAWIGGLLGAGAFVMSFSRAGFAGLTAAVAAYLLLAHRRNGIRAAVAVVAAAAVAAALAFNLHHDPSENFTRLSIWQAALESVKRFPFSGVGPFDFSRIYPFVRLPGSEPTAYHAHSLVVTLIAETGLFGMALIGFAWWGFVTRFRAALRSAPRTPALAVAIVAGLAGTWVQGLIDTVSIVIFGLWLPFMALALVTACGGSPAVARAHRAPGRLAVAAGVAAGAFALACAAVQLASMSAYAAAAVPYAVADRLPAGLGTRWYAAFERIAPLPFVEDVLAEDALRHDRPATAAAYAAKLPPGRQRSDVEARIALDQDRETDAITAFLAADDDQALEAIVTGLAARGHLSDAYALQQRVVERLAADETRPNALAEASWRLARLALQLGDTRAAAAADDRALALAPFNIKYLLDAGMFALQRHDVTTATARFKRVTELDPTDADAYAGVGLATLQGGDVAAARSWSVHADALDARAVLAAQLHQALRPR